MFRSLLVAGFVLSFATVTLAQQPDRNVSEKPERFRAAVEVALARHHFNWPLYRTCDVVRRAIDREASRMLGRSLTKSVQSTPAPNSVTASDSVAISSNVNDVSNEESQQNETTVAISRTNPNLIVAACNDDSMLIESAPAYVSTNAGTSWATYRLPAIDDFAAEAFGDPILICDDKGLFYYAFLVDGFDTTNISDIVIGRSTDGVHWKLGAFVLGNLPRHDTYVIEDKETIAVDRDATSPHHGRLFVAWTEYNPDSIPRHLVAHSDNAGMSWSRPVAFGTGYGFFASIRVGKGGTVFIESSTGDDPEGGHGLSVSHDGGETFVSRDIWSFVNYPIDSGQRPGLKGGLGFRSYPYVTFDYDFANERLATVYCTYENTYGAIYTMSSNDEGLTWSKRRIVGSATGLRTDHFQPWVASDPVTHETFISFYSSEDDPKHNLLTRFARVRYDAPDLPEFLEPEAYNPLDIGMLDGQPFIGDYTGADAYGGTFAAVWTQTQTGLYNGDLFAYVSTNNPIMPVTRRITSTPFVVSDPVPNPTWNGTVTFTLSCTPSSVVSIVVYDIRGARVFARELTAGSDGALVVPLDLHRLPGGVYRALISTGGETLERNIIVF